MAFGEGTHAGAGSGGNQNDYNSATATDGAGAFAGGAGNDNDYNTASATGDGSLAAAFVLAGVGGLLAAASRLFGRRGGCRDE